MAYILRGFFDRALDRDLERYKSELGIRDFEHQTRYSLIHSKRAEVISTLYALVVRCVREVATLVRVWRFSDGESLRDKKQRAADRFNEMNDYFAEHRLYFETDTSNLIDQLASLVRESMIEFDVAQPGDEIEHGPTNDPELWKSAHERIKNEVGPILESLEAQFKSLIEVGQEAYPLK